MHRSCSSAIPDSTLHVHYTLPGARVGIVRYKAITLPYSADGIPIICFRRGESFGHMVVQGCASCVPTAVGRGSRVEGEMRLDPLICGCVDGLQMDSAVNCNATLIQGLLLDRSRLSLFAHDRIQALTNPLENGPGGISLDRIANVRVRVPTAFFRGRCSVVIGTYGNIVSHVECRHMGELHDQADYRVCLATADSHMARSSSANVKLGCS
jgi:hypothetical protein